MGESVISVVGTRDTARRQMPPSLREEVHLVGELLGQVIAEQAGDSLLADVEQLRRTVIRARTDGDLRGGHVEAAGALVASWSLDRAEQVARAFTCYFHLVNLAEERFRARALREPDHGAQAPPYALASALAEVRDELGDDGLSRLLAGMEVCPVFTAHPTEARRRAVTSAVRRVGEQLERRSDPRASDAAQAEARRRLLEEVDGLWRTAQLRIQELQPLDEVRALMGVFDETLFRLIPELYREFDTQLIAGEIGARMPAVPPFVQFGSWVGGDRDGNPHITARVTLETMLIQSEHILRGLEAAAARIGRSLTADSVSTPPDAQLLVRLHGARRIAGARAAEIEARSPGNRIGSFCSSSPSGSRRPAARICHSRMRDPTSCLTTFAASRSRSSQPGRRARHLESSTTLSGRCRPSASTWRSSRFASTARCIAPRSPS